MRVLNVPGLSPRLQALAVRVPSGAVPADIGTDHARLPIQLVAGGHCPRAIAVEVAPGPLEQARRAVDRAGLAGRIDLRLADGLAGLAPGEADVLVVAGVGGATITRILAARPAAGAAIPLWILQPLSSSGRVRHHIAASGHGLVDEDLVAEGGRIYEVMVARRGEGAEPAVLPDELPDDISPLLVAHRHPLLPHLIRARMDKYRRLLERVAAAVPHSRRAGEASREFQGKLAALDEILTRLEY